MSNVGDTLVTAWDWAAHGGDKAIEFAEFVIKYQLMHLVTLGIGSALGSYLASRYIHKGIFKEHTVNIGETLYVPSGIINPATGEEFVDQKLITLDDGFMLRKAFRGETGKELAKRVEKAAKLSDFVEIIAFSHLHKVIRTRDFAHFKEMVSKQWRGHFSGTLNRHDPQSHEIGVRQYPEEKIILPLPVFEKSPEGGSCKIMFVPLRYLKPDGLPKLENLRVQVGLDDEGKPHFEHDPGHQLNERLRTLQKIRDIVNQDRDGWLSDFAVSVQTGRVIDVPSPTVSL